jgi:RNA polymerase sigma factor (TIGR02999 family)
MPDDLLPLVYTELRRLAAAKLSKEKPGQTLQATALVHEAWLRLEQSHPGSFNGRTHYFRAAAEAMRRILVDKAREKQAVKRGGQMERTELFESKIADSDIGNDQELLEVHEALEKLTTQDPQSADLVKLRYFAGMPLQEVATALDMSLRTAERRWTFVKAWLRKELHSRKL